MNEMERLENWCANQLDDCLCCLLLPRRVWKISITKRFGRRPLPTALRFHLPTINIWMPNDLSASSRTCVLSMRTSHQIRHDKLALDLKLSKTEFCKVYSSRLVQIEKLQTKLWIQFYRTPSTGWLNESFRDFDEHLQFAFNCWGVKRSLQSRNWNRLPNRGLTISLSERNFSNLNVSARTSLTNAKEFMQK